MKYNCLVISWFSCLFFLNSCSTTVPGKLFGKKSPHEKYGQHLVKAGLKETALGRMWFTAAEQSLKNPLSIKTPHKESGFFPAEEARAFGVRFEAKKGEKLDIKLEKNPDKNFTIYVDLWEVRDKDNKILLAYADTGGTFTHEIDEDGFYTLRLQPELLGEGQYTLTIINGPSLAFPVKNGKVGSFWGAGRDGGLRKHEGIDIFAPRRTPALAVADGRISRVTTNELGGKVIFMRPYKRNYIVYYAHLDEQLVSAGQSVKAGDTLGLIGNTGNARFTSPHLHLGIYTIGGAIDPLAFVNPVKKPVPPVKAPLENLGERMRTSNYIVKLYENIAGTSEVGSKLKPYTILEILSASNNFYRILLPDGRDGFVRNTGLNSIKNPIEKINLPISQFLYNNPSTNAAQKTELTKGTFVNILGNYESYYYVKTAEHDGWINKEYL